VPRSTPNGDATVDLCFGRPGAPRFHRGFSRIRPPARIPPRDRPPRRTGPLPGADRRDRPRGL